MARIENQVVYPLKSNPVSTDYIIGTDSENNNETVSFSIAALQTAIGATIYTDSNIIPVDRTVTHNAQMSFTGNMAASEFIAQHTNGHILRVNQDGIFGTSLGIGTLANVASAVLQVNSTTKGFLPPRMTEAQRDAIVVPENGLTIFNTDSGFLEYYDGSLWVTNTNTNIYTTDGTITGVTRTITGETSASLDFIMYNSDASDWVNRGVIGLTSLASIFGHQTGDGAGAVNQSQLIIFNVASMLVIDEVNSKGLEYAADYSANYTDRSLVDKGYVDGIVGVTTIYTGNGTITDENRTITLNDTDDSNELFTIVAQGTASKTAQLVLGHQSALISVSNPSGILGLSLESGQGIVTDSINTKGLVYAADYSANFTARSLVDKDYVDGVAGSTFYTSNGTIDATTRTVLGTNATAIQYQVHDLLSSTFLSRSNINFGATQLILNFEQGNGAGAVSGLSGISANAASFTVTDSINNKGLVYAADYSANYTDRSLVDKAYVDDQISNVPNLYNADGIISGATRTVTGETSASLDIIMYNSNASNWVNRGAIELSPLVSIFAHQTGDGAGAINQSQLITFNGASMLITDEINTKGLEYVADYSANFVDRSIIDKGYVDNETPNTTVLVRTASDFGVIDSTKVYVIDGIVDMGSTIIEVPAGGINVQGFDFNPSKLISSDNSFSLFTSPVGGSGDISVQSLSFEITGSGSQVFDVVAATGNEAIEMKRVNFNNCTSRGVIDNYRQVLETTIGLFGGTPELEFRNVMSGYRGDTFIVRGISNISSLFIAGAGLSFTGRFALNINCDLPALGALIDFAPSNFTMDEACELQECFVTRSGVIDSTDTTIYPNIDESDTQSLWSNNNGLPNTNKVIKASITAEVATVISVINTYEVLLGTFTVDVADHFDMPSNGQFRLLAGNGKYQISGDLVVDGGTGDVLDIRITKSTDGGTTFPEIIGTVRRQVNALVGGRDVAFFSLGFIAELKKDDRVRIEVANETTTTNVTVELDSYIIVTSA